MWNEAAAVAARRSELFYVCSGRKLSLSAAIQDAKRLQTQIAPQKGPKTSFEIRVSTLYVFEIFLC